MLVIPNIFDIIGPAPGLLGWVKLLYRTWRQRYRSFQVVLIGLTSKYQNSILGSVIAGVAFAEERRRLRAKGVDFILGWVQEDNHPLLRAFHGLGFGSFRAYALYEKRLVT
jgi:hypothetical protein